VADESKFVRENRYLVIKWSDVHSVLSTEQGHELLSVINVLNDAREKAGRGVLECVVVEKDWPEYEPTWRAIERRVRGEPPESSQLPEGFAITAQLGAMDKMSIRMRLAAAAMLEEIRDQIVSRNTRITELSAEVTRMQNSEIVGYMVSTNGITRYEAMYNADEHAKALSAAIRWGGAITPLVRHPNAVGIIDELPRKV
jgi:hypothetical protein